MKFFAQMLSICASFTVNFSGIQGQISRSKPPYLKFGILTEIILA